jgi:NAD(P)-dependent dehydrogenase (short-subunit alcohol dehydrogenase family)
MQARMPRSRTLMLGAAAGAGFVLRSLIRRTTAYELRDKVALVTGGSRGLGLVLARELVARGVRVAICARDGEELVRAARDLAVRGGSVLALACDITDRAQLDRMVADVTDELGPIDILVNNAGIMEVGPMELMGDADFERAMDTHFWAALHCVQAVLPDMVARGAGRIVNITSIGGKLAVPHLLPYSASKFALVGLSEGLAAELAKRHVGVTTVVPGLMRTGSALRARFRGRHRAEYAWFATTASSQLTSMQAERAARRIIRAIRHGEPEVVLSVQAKLAAIAAAIAPSLVQRGLAIVNRLLPEPGGIGELEATGLASRSTEWVARLTRSTERAAMRNNEL